MSRRLNGTTDSIDLTDTPFDFDSGSSFSITSHVNPDVDATRMVIAGKRASTGALRGYEVVRETDNTIHVLLVNNFGGGDLIEVRSTNTVPSGQSTAITVTYDGSSTAAGVKIYFDRVLETNVVITDALTGTILNNVNLQWGVTAGADFWDGLLAWSNVHNVELTPGEAATAFSVGYAFRGAVSILPLWGLGSPEADLSGNGNNGTLVGTTVDVSPAVGRYVTEGKKETRRIDVEETGIFYIKGESALEAILSRYIKGDVALQIQGLVYIKGETEFTTSKVYIKGDSDLRGRLDRYIKGDVQFFFNSVYIKGDVGLVVTPVLGDLGETPPSDTKAGILSRQWLSVAAVKKDVT